MAEEVNISVQDVIPSINKSIEYKKPAIRNRSFEKGIDRLKSHDWKKELQKKGFTGDLDNGVALMNAFTEGSIDALQSRKKRNQIPESFKLPEIQLTNDPNVQSASYTSKSNGERLQKAKKGIIKVQINYVQRLSVLNQNEMYSQLYSNGEITSSGTPAEMIYRDGAEETHHAVDFQSGLVDPSTILSSSTVKSLAQYDAQDHEYKQLGWSIRHFKDQNKLGIIDNQSTQIIIEPLQKRLDAAIRYRKENKPQSPREQLQELAKKASSD